MASLPVIYLVMYGPIWENSVRKMDGKETWYLHYYIQFAALSWCLSLSLKTV